MKRSFFLILFGLLFAPTMAAHASVCVQNMEAPTVSISVEEGDIRYHHGYDSKGLERLRQQRGGRAVAGSWKPTGLTLSNLNFALGVEITAHSLHRGGYCAYLRKVVAKLHYEPFQVYISRKYKKGTCQYRSVMAHELTHVELYREVLRTYAPQMQRLLEREAKNLKPVIVRSASQGADQLQRALQQKTQRLFKEIDRAQETANGRIDTPENYLRESKNCKSW